MVDPPSCPTCGAPGVPILRGLPSPEAVEAADQGKLAIGGCVVGLDPLGDPHWQCSAEETHRWGRDASDNAVSAAAIRQAMR